MEGSRAVLYKWIFTQSMRPHNISLRVPSSQLVNPPPQNKKLLFLDCKKRLKKITFPREYCFYEWNEMRLRWREREKKINSYSKFTFLWIEAFCVIFFLLATLLLLHLNAFISCIKVIEYYQIKERMMMMKKIWDETIELVFIKKIYTSKWKEEMKFILIIAFLCGVHSLIIGRIGNLWG